MSGRFCLGVMVHWCIGRLVDRCFGALGVLGFFCVLCVLVRWWFGRVGCIGGVVAWSFARNGGLV